VGRRKGWEEGGGGSDFTWEKDGIKTYKPFARGGLGKVGRRKRSTSSMLRDVEGQVTEEWTLGNRVKPGGSGCEKITVGEGIVAQGEGENR